MAYTVTLPANLDDPPAALAALARNTQRHPDFDLMLPARFTGGRPGGRALSVQLLVTWAGRGAPERAVRIATGDNVTPQELYERLAVDTHLLVAYLTGVTVRSQSGTDITNRLAGPAKQLLYDRQRKHLPSSDERQNRGDRREGLYIASDALPLLAPGELYLSRDASRRVAHPVAPLIADAYTPIADQILGLRHHAQFRRVDPRVLSATSWAIYELFHNSHQWGRTAPSGAYGGVSVKNAVRAVMARPHTYTQSAIAGAAVYGPALHAYLAALAQRDSKAIARVIVISVFDNGPGITSRRLKRSLPGEATDLEEVAALRWCLAKRRTTSLDPLRGLGYHRALLALSELGGFLEIRSGGLLVQRDLSINPYPSTRESEDAATGAHRTSWTDADFVEAGAPVMLPSEKRVTGTVVNLIIPIGERMFTREDSTS